MSYNIRRAIGLLAEQPRDTERYFVPFTGLVGMLSKSWGELSSEEKRIAIPVNLVYENQIKF